MNRLLWPPQPEAGFSLLESVTSVFVLSVVLVVIVPLWSDIQSIERLAAKITRASQLAADEIERAYAGSARPGSWSVTAEAGEFTIRAERSPDTAGTRLRVSVFFRERGEDHEVVYESLVP
ncbi:hypothetical protein [Effusibacillus pohliae]|uniref:hypothetical protein n=1 Tax=Effusibacillus pohliae TaxID=232270 RepID=UPI000380E75B|nr:hypothetical protein [Effusibacillus pohliae]